MNSRSTFIPFLILSLTFLVNQQVAATKIYQWTDEEGGVHFSDVLPKDTSAILAIENDMAAKAYQWTDKEGDIHFSDMPPEGANTIEISEINIDSFDDNSVDPEKYSIINQADRMAERRRQTTEERLAKKRLQLEEKRLAIELEQSRLNEILNAQAYEPRSYVYAYPQQYFHHPRQFYSQHGNHNQLKHRQSRKPHRIKHSAFRQRTSAHRLKVGIGL